VILGEVGLNLGAGMTGGQAYLYGDAENLGIALNDDLVVAHEPDATQLDEVHGLLERHVRHTGSTRAAAILERWGEESLRFTRIAARTELEAARAADEAAVVAP
jgi:glutamate synthase domain-containing protein 3